MQNISVLSYKRYRTDLSLWIIKIGVFGHISLFLISSFSLFLFILFAPHSCYHQAIAAIRNFKHNWLIKFWRTKGGVKPCSDVWDHRAVCVILFTSGYVVSDCLDWSFWLNLFFVRSGFGVPSADVLAHSEEKEEVDNWIGWIGYPQPLWSVGTPNEHLFDWWSVVDQSKRLARGDEETHLMLSAGLEWRHSNADV